MAKKKKTAKPELSAEARDAVALGEELLRLIDEDVPERALDKATDFFEGVQEKTASILESIQQYGTVTEKQRTALENMTSAVQKWIR